MRNFGLRDSALLLLLILPWLSPLAPGPLPNVVPWLLAFFCALMLWLGRYQLTSELILKGWTLAALASAIVGVLQYAGLTQGLSSWLVQAHVGEAYGNLRQRNQFATLCNIGLTALLWSSVHKRSIQRAGPLRLAGMAALLAAGNAASLSRTGLLQFILLLAVAMLWGVSRQRQGRQILLAALLAYGLSSQALPQLVSNVQDVHSVWSRLGADEHACNSRRVMWHNVLHLIALKPWLGWGWGELDYAHFMTLYPGPRFCEILGNAHNLPLHLAVELGVPAALLAFGLLIWLICRLRPWRESQPYRQAAWMVLGMILLHSLLEYPLWYGPFQLAVLLSVWMLLPTRSMPVQAQKRLRERTFEIVLASGMLVAMACVAWDYHRISQIYLDPEVRSSQYREHTLKKVRNSWLFQDTVRFAEFMLTSQTPENARYLHAWGLELLHYSPEPGVVAKLLDCARLLDEPDQKDYEQRFKAAYPQEYEAWKKRQEYSSVLQGT